MADWAHGIIGHEAIIGDLDRAFASGELHHSLLFNGPRGLGKSTLAKAFANWALRRDPADPREAVHIGRLIAQRAHPDLLILEQDEERTKSGNRKEIAADDVRAIGAFYALKPAMAKRRVVILDAIDDLNRFGVNAILKSLEEPPAHGIFIVIYHGEIPLLPTIRSRCRRFRFRELAAEAMAPLLESVETASASKQDELLALAEVRPGRALQLIQGEGAQMLLSLRALLHAPHRLTWPALVEALRPPNQENVGEAMDQFAQAAKAAALRAARRQALSPASAWANVWRQLIALQADMYRLNLDPLNALSKAHRLIAPLADEKAG